MPVRPLSSAVLVWPEARVVDAEARRWAEDVPVDLLVYTRAEWATLPAPPHQVVWMSGIPA